MHHTFLRNIRRFLIGIIALVAVAVSANYLYTRYQKSRVAEEILPVLDSETVQLAQRIEYFDNRDGGVLRLKIVAQQHIETRQGKNLLQGIEAFDYNPDGSVRSEIRSWRALYDSGNHTVDFIEDVRLFLGEDVELRTESLHYDLDSNIGTTEAPLQFYSGEVSGKARGMLYDMTSQSLKFKEDVDLLLTPEEKTPGGVVPSEEFHVVSQRAVTHENLQRIECIGSARLESETLLLTGGSIEAVMDETDKKLKMLTANGNARYRSDVSGMSRMLAGDRIVFLMHPQTRSPEEISVSGHAVLDFISPEDVQHLRSSEINLHLDPERGEPTGLEGRREVRLEMIRGKQRTVISGERFQALFFGESRGLSRIDVEKRAGISMEGVPGSESNEIRAERIRMLFRESADQSVLKNLRAESSAQWLFQTVRSGSTDAETPLTGTSSGKLTAAVIEMHYASDSEFLERIDASGDVVLTEVPSEGVHAPIVHTMYSDLAGFYFYPHENRMKTMSAQGNVRLVDSGEPNSAKGGKDNKFRTWSDRMTAEFDPDTEAITLKTASQWGNFRYEDASSSATAGRCDYDAHKDLVELSGSPEVFFDRGSTTGESVEYNRASGTVSVRGNVRSVLTETGGTDASGNAFKNSRSIVLAGVMQYQSGSGRTRYTNDVFLLSEEQQLRANFLEISNNGARVLAEGDVRHIIPAYREDKIPMEMPVNETFLPEKEDVNTEKQPIRIKSAKLEYVEAANTVKYRGGVSLSSTDLSLTSEILDAVLDETGNAVDTLIASDNVVVIKGGRKCSGEVAHFFSNPESFVITGSPAVCDDAAGERSYPYRLTYTEADGSIQLEMRQD